MTTLTLQEQMPGIVIRLMDKLFVHYAFSLIFIAAPVPQSSMLGHSSQEDLQKNPTLNLGEWGGGANG